MKLCNRDILKIHGVHPVWSSLPSATREVKKAQIKLEEIGSISRVFV
jgi:hypothetical protein